MTSSNIAAKARTEALSARKKDFFFAQLETESIVFLT
jgi:hypothetical protein